MVQLVRGGPGIKVVSFHDMHSENCFFVVVYRLTLFVVVCGLSFVDIVVCRCLAFVIVCCLLFDNCRCSSLAVVCRRLLFFDLVCCCFLLFVIFCCLLLFAVCC